MRHALVACVLSTVASAQLPASTSWKYSVVSGGGSSTRVFFFLESPAPSTRKAREWWTVETGAAAADGSMPLTRTVRDAEGERKTVFKTWPTERGVMTLEAGAPPERAQLLVTRQAPPRVLSMERVPCSAPLLGGVGATCSGRAGGPLHQPELPLLVQVSDDTDRMGRRLAAFGTFLISGGVLLPGTDDRSVVARLELPASSLSPTLNAWRKGAHTAAALAKLKFDDDAETLGALVVLGGAPSLEVVQALTQRASMLDRWPLVRLARGSGADARFVVQLVARLVVANALSAPADAPRRELQASALNGLGASLTTAVEALVAGGMPTLRTVAATAKKLDADAARALETAPLTPGEGAALAQLMSKAALNTALPRFIERLPDEEGLVTLDALDDADERRLSTLQRLPNWVDRVLQGAHGAELLKSLNLDAQRVTLLKSAWSRAPERHLQLLRLAMETMAFDAARLELLRLWLPKTPLTLADCRAVLDAFTSDEGRDQAGRLMLPAFTGAERSALVTHWLRKTRDSALRLRALKELSPAMNLDDARAVYDAISFDDERVGSAGVLLPLVPEANRAELFVYCVTHLSFDAGRLELLKAPARPSLNTTQTDRVLNAFVFERDKAVQLLR